MATTLNLTFIHPTDNSSIEAVCESGWSADFAISELIRQGFLKELPNPDKEEYRLLYKEDQTEFRGTTTFEEVGAQDNKVISVVIRPKAGHKHYYDDDTELRDAYENACASGNMKVDVDFDEIHSDNDIFEVWKYETGRSSHSDYNWESEEDD